MSWELSRVRLQLLNLNRKQKKCRDSPGKRAAAAGGGAHLSVSSLASFRPRPSARIPASVRSLLLRSRSLRRDVLMAADSLSQQFAVSLHALSLSEQRKAETEEPGSSHRAGSRSDVVPVTHLASWAALTTGSSLRSPSSERAYWLSSNTHRSSSDASRTTTSAFHWEAESLPWCRCLDLR